MVKAAERAHKAVQDLKAQADRIAQSHRGEISDGAADAASNTSKRLANLTESGAFAKLRDATAQIRADAKADWKDIKDKFKQ